MASETKRMTKEELREDEFVEWLVSAVDYIRDHRNPFIIGVLIVVGGILGLRTFIDSQEQNKRDAAALFGDVLIAEQGGQNIEAVKKAEHIIKNYEGSPAAGKATIFLANLYYSQTKYEEAERLYRSYLDSGENGNIDILNHAAEMGLLACSEVNGNLEQAAVAYEGLGLKYSGSLGAFSLMRAVRCYKQLGDLDRTKNILERLNNEYPNLPIAQKARGILEML
ncbi:MAG: tetratricopeptide repeat protein [Candidatus Latescibacterota bacterium]|nr:tetratricopeptide repeat protein [Candidatus Latescibacterota bacterium]